MSTSSVKPLRPTALVISNIAWDFIWQRHQTIASLLARDLDVVYCELPGIRRVGWRDLPRIVTRLSRLCRGTSAGAEACLDVLRPFVLPPMRARLGALNDALIRRFVRRNPRLREGVDLVITYTAARPAMRLLDAVPRRVLIYDCTDNFSAVHGVSDELLANEKLLLERAEVTFVPGLTLAERHRPRARRIEVVPHGALVERFQLERPRRFTSGDDIVLVYYGHIHRQHLDFGLISKVAGLRPSWRIILVGPVMTPFVFSHNVVLAGQQLHERLRDFLRDAHAIVLPYAINDYTRAVFPAKTYECLATGLPIVSTPLPELQAAFPDLIRYAARAEEVVAAVEAAVNDDPLGRMEARIAAARVNSWEERVIRLKAVLVELAPEIFA
ncbi:MAG: glycosyltransferase [Opitutaceae bacterium]